MSDAEILKILKRIPDLPDSATVPIPVAAKHDGVSEQTVRKHYPLMKLSPNRWGVSVGFLRQPHRGLATA
jgi:hypothetical protein